MLFATGIHQSLVDIQNRRPDVVVLAYLDDVFVLGPGQIVLHAFDDLKASFSKLSLTVADHKCEIFSPISSLSSTPISCHSSGTTVLGSLLGPAVYVEETCLRQAKKGDELCRMLQYLDDPQCSLLLLRHCHATRLNHLGRSVPSYLLRSAIHHDGLTISTFQKVLLIESLSESQRQQATLPINLAGFGLPLLSTICDAAFLSGWSSSLNAISDRYPDEWTTDDILSLPSINSQLGAALSTFQAHLGSTSAKFQKLLLSEIQIASLSSILSSAADNRDLSRLRSCRGKHAGRWLEAVPTSRMLALKPCEFR